MQYIKLMTVLMLLAGCIVAPQIVCAAATTASVTTDSQQTTSAQVANLPLSVVYKPVGENPKIGDLFVVHVELTLSPDITLNEINYGEKFGDWEIKEVKKGQVQCEGSSCKRTDQLTLVSYASGIIEIGSIPFGFQTTDGRSGEFRPVPISIKVDGLETRQGDEEGSIRGLKAPQGMISWIIVAAVLATIACIIGAVWFIRKRRLEQLANQPAEPSRPPEDMAREKLEQLRHQNLIENGAGKAYYIELISIFRHYIEGRFSIPAVDMTTHELHRELRHSTLAKPDVVRIKALLDHSDLVKFAKAEVEQKEADEHWQLVWMLVEKTTEKKDPESLEKMASSKSNE